MTISAQSTVCTYAGDGVQDTWPIPFAILEPHHIGGIKTTPRGEAKNLIYGQDFSVQKHDNGSWNVICSVPQGETVTWFLHLEHTQPIDLQNSGILAPEVIEQGLDRLTLSVQQLQEGIDRSIKVGMTSKIAPEQLISTLLRSKDDCLGAVALAKQGAEESKQAQLAAEVANRAAQAASDKLHIPVPVQGRGIVGDNKGGWQVGGTAVSCDWGRGGNDVPVNNLLPRNVPPQAILSGPVHQWAKFLGAGTVSKRAVHLSGEKKGDKAEIVKLHPATCLSYVENQRVYSTRKMADWIKEDCTSLPDGRNYVSAEIDDTGTITGLHFSIIPPCAGSQRVEYYWGDIEKYTMPADVHDTVCNGKYSTFYGDIFSPYSLCDKNSDSSINYNLLSGTATLRYVFHNRQLVSGVAFILDGEGGKVDVQVSDDGTLWETVVSTDTSTLATNERLHLQLPTPRLTRQLRVFFKSRSGESRKFLIVKELVPLVCGDFFNTSNYTNSDREGNIIRRVPLGWIEIKNHVVSVIHSYAFGDFVVLPANHYSKITKNFTYVIDSPYPLSMASSLVNCEVYDARDSRKTDWVVLNQGMTHSSGKTIGMVGHVVGDKILTVTGKDGLAYGDAPSDLHVGGSLKSLPLLTEAWGRIKVHRGY